MSFEIAIQKYIFSTLTNSPLINAPVLDDVPDDQEYPYITIGEALHNEDSADNLLIQLVSCNIHVWSRGSQTNNNKGKLQTKTIQGQIYDALNRTQGEADNYSINAVDFESSQTFLDSDNLTRHGVSTFNIRIQRR